MWVVVGVCMGQGMRVDWEWQLGLHTEIRALPQGTQDEPSESPAPAMWQLAPSLAWAGFVSRENGCLEPELSFGAS